MMRVEGQWGQRWVGGYGICKNRHASLNQNKTAHAYMLPLSIYLFFIGSLIYIFTSGEWRDF